MNTAPCPREPDVLEAVSSGAWPEACGGELRTHVGSCHACAEVADIATALRQDAEALARRAFVPSAGAMWWKIASRRRREARHTAERPIALAHWLAAASVAGAAAAVAAMLAPLSAGATTTLAAHFESLGRSPLLVQGSLALVAGLLSLLVAPIVIYLVLIDD
jgi:hypothetical protein